jgi:hypothetical protein
MCLFKPAPLKAGYFCENEVEIAEFKSFDVCPRFLASARAFL